jgi:outer membrane protein insertion porin family
VFRSLRQRGPHGPLVPCLLFILALALLCGSARTARARQQPASPSPSPAAAQPQQQTIKLNKIEFEGLKRLAREDALAKLGLQEGQAYTPEFIDEAASRLASSGLFRKFAYGVSGRTDGATLTFRVEEDTESNALVPVVFDNFVWFTDEELHEAIRRRLPDFDGRAPQAGDATDQITSALEELLRARNIPSRGVEYNLSTDAAGRNPEHIFTVAGASLRVCRLAFPGARTFTEGFLVQKAGSIFGNEYSRKYIEGYTQATLLPLYHERGLLRASFLPPRARPYKGEDCEDGLSVTVPVDEGSIYVWDRAEWSGNSALTPKELDAALGMKAREIANGLSFDRGLEAVRRAYGRKGHLATRLTAAPVFDDENRRVAYRIEVAEGPQYRMGDLVIKGLSEQDTNNLRGRWRLLHGEVYDEGYPAEFTKTTLPEFFKYLTSEGRPLPNTAPAINVTPDHERRTVLVTIEFKSAQK